MSNESRSLLERYQPYRRGIEIGFWVVNYCLAATLNTITTVLDIERVHLSFADWQVAVWEWSSNLVMLALVPAVIAFERRFPLHLDTLRRNLPIHALAAVVYSAAHVVAMVGLRKLAYASQGEFYDFGHWPTEMFYEFLKDWRSYAGVLLVLGAYDLLLLRLQGEARLLTEPDEGPAVDPVERPDRFLVRKLGKEFLVAANDIEVLQASGNYVNLRVRGREYPLRSTMAAIEPRLDPARFVRVHRSYMVNLDHVAEIEPLDTGDARLTMHDGSRVPCSRRYRDVLRK
ncbi:LytTR family DNA-binding domain-containing protein [Arenimonas sp.]|uniref:LytTR family DNA-binding domain-containing protein n=1 Tax=Arenimonas sp. TaxID=1872635 RepID=UPI0039E3D795